MGMFVRRNRNRSGSVSVGIVSKQGGAYRIVQTVGTSKDLDEIERFALQAQDIINHPKGQLNLFPMKSHGALAVETFVRSLSNAQVHTVGPELIFGTLFDSIGFNAIHNELFRHITIARLAYPTSKLKTADYLYRYKGIRIDKHAIYRFLDELHSKYKDAVEKIAYKYTEKTLKVISIVFYDITTLYFESEDEDDLRKIGFSKDGKFQHPQIMLGLLVGKGGYPIGYDIFEGNTFEGHTLIPILEKIQKKYGFGKPIVVADAALLSRDNLENLRQARYQFIVGARIKNETEAIKEDVLKQGKGMMDGNTFVVKKEDGTRLVISYSSSRAGKDVYNRQRGIRKLRTQIKSGRLTKEHINNRGYNKFLKLTGKVVIAIDEEKVQADVKWDGLKGYITNTRLSPKMLIEHYRELWQIEKAFRISKTDLRIRPIFHYRKRRIESHICIVFVAYTIYKELERLLSKHQAQFSPKRAAELTHNMYELEYMLPGEVSPAKTLLKMDSEQQRLYDIVHL